MVDDGSSSGVTFRVAEGVAGIWPGISLAKSCSSARSIAGVLKPVMASGDEVVGALLSRSCANLTEVGTLVNLIDPEAEDVVESIEAFVRGLTLSSGPGDVVHGDGSGIKGDIVETASDTLVGIAKGDESPVRETDSRRSEGSSERRLNRGELHTAAYRASAPKSSAAANILLLTSFLRPDPGPTPAWSPLSPFQILYRLVSSSSHRTSSCFEPRS